MSFNQMQNAYQKTMKQSQAYKETAIKKGLMNKEKKQFQPDLKGVPKTASSQLKLAQQDTMAKKPQVQNEVNQTTSTPFKQISKNISSHSQARPKAAIPKLKNEQPRKTASATKSTSANVYKQNAFSTASPGELTLILYNACLKFIEKAEKAIDEKDIESKNKFIIRAQDIIRELMVTLKTDTEVGKGMLTVYDFINVRLVDANVKNDKTALGEAKQFVTEFRDTWKQVIQINRKEQHGLNQA